MSRRTVRVPLLCAAATVMITAAPAIVSADPPDAREVTLQVAVNADGGCSITVIPEIGVIEHGNNAKIKKVYWVALPNDQHPQLFWELRWDPDKGGASENYFGNVDLACGIDNIKVQPDKPKIDKAEWPYAVTVFACVDGMKSDQLCTVDPRIRWENVPE
jgi:hypothetical protein